VFQGEVGLDLFSERLRSTLLVMWLSLASAIPISYLKGPGGFEVMISQGSHKCLVKY